MRRTIIVTVLVFLILAAIGGGIGYYVYNNYTFYQTDDAQVSGQIVSVSAPAAGTLTTLNVKIGDKVTAGQAIGTVTPATATASAIDLTSPISGTILQTPAVQGQTVAPGLTLVSLTDLSAVTVTAYVDEGAINNVSTGQQVDVTVDAYSGTTFTGRVQQIVQATAGSFSLLPNQDPTSGNFTKVGQRIPVIVSLDGGAGKDLVPGMSATATIHLH